MRAKGHRAAAAETSHAKPAQVTRTWLKSYTSYGVAKGDGTVIALFRDEPTAEEFIDGIAGLQLLKVRHTRG